MTTEPNPNETAQASCAPAAGSAAACDEVVIELKLPVPVKELAAITDALCGIHGKHSLFMRQVGPMLQIYKAQKASPQTEKLTDR